MSDSLAAVFDGVSGSISLRKIATPRPDGDEILVKVLGCTLCGSDVHSFEGRRMVPVPTVLGHEIVGEIQEFGNTALRRDAGGLELQSGDRITWAIVASCGACPLCECGLPQKCLRAVKYGHESFRPGRELLGGLAEHCLLVPGTSIVRLPSCLPLSVACPASCATATIVAAFEAAGETIGRSVCIFGAGMLGLTACAIARSSGAGKVTCVDPVESRRNLALRFGATHVLSPADFECAPEEITGKLGFDVILELSGVPQAFHAAWPRIRLGGTLVLVGSVFPSAPVPLALEQVVRRQLTLRGVHNYAPRHLLKAVEFLTRHHQTFPFAELVNEWLPLSLIEKGFERSQQSSTIRVGIKCTE